MIKRKKKRNPSPELLKKLSKLIGNELTVRYKTNCLYFHVKGILELTKFHNIYEIAHLQKGSLRFLNVIRFDQINVNDIIDNSIIDLDSLQSDRITQNYSITEINDKLQELIKDNNDVRINLNFPFPNNEKENSIISGKLKYDRRYDEYYIKNKDLYSFIKFGAECVNEVSYNAKYIVLDINK